MVIDLINEKDIGAILHLLEQLYLELGEEKESISYLDELLIRRLTSNEKTLIFKAVNQDSQIIGFMTLTESQAIYTGGDYGVIDEMYIEPEYRSQNIGKQLIQKAKFIGKVRGWNRIDVTAPTEKNERVRKFYENNGFVFTGPKLKIKL